MPHLSGGSREGLLRWPWRRRSSGSKIALAVLPLALFVAWPSAPVAAQAATTSSTSAGSTCLLGLLGCTQGTTATASSPSPNCVLGLVDCGSATGPDSGLCVGGIVLCGNNVIGQPTPCVSGSLLCGGSPPPTPCTGGEVLCSGAILGPGDSSPPVGPPSGGKKTSVGAAGSSEQLPGTANVSVALGVPPGVGLVPAALGSFGVSGPNPDGFSDLLSLSIRDGLAPGGSQLWPALAMLQAVLLLVIVGAFAARQVLEASAQPEG